MLVSPLKPTREPPMNGLVVVVVVVVALMDTVVVGVVVVAIIVVMFVVFVAATVVLCKPSRAAIDIHEYNIREIYSCYCYYLINSTNIESMEVEGLCSRFRTTCYVLLLTPKLLCAIWLLYNLSIDGICRCGMF